MIETVGLGMAVVLLYIIYRVGYRALGDDNDPTA